MKFNWGTGIALVYAVFALSMIGAVFASRKYDPVLVQKNYYDLDLNYQARMDKKQNASALAELPKVQFKAKEKSIAVAFPSGMGVSGGSAKVYRAATTSDDFTVQIGHTDSLSIPANNLSAGRWHLELDWEANGKPYFWETVVVVN